MEHTTPEEDAQIERALNHAETLSIAGTPNPHFFNLYAILKRFDAVIDAAEIKISELEDSNNLWRIREENRPKMQYRSEERVDE